MSRRLISTNHYIQTGETLSKQMTEWFGWMTMSPHSAPYAIDDGMMMMMKTICVTALDKCEPFCHSVEVVLL